MKCYFGFARSHGALLIYAVRLISLMKSSRKKFVIYIDDAFERQIVTLACYILELALVSPTSML